MENHSISQEQAHLLKSALMQIKSGQLEFTPASESAEDLAAFNELAKALFLADREALARVVVVRLKEQIAQSPCVYIRACHVTAHVVDWFSAQGA